MALEAKTILEDIRQAADLAARFTTGKTREDYIGDPLLQAAVERKFEIIGEAVQRLAKTAPGIASRITDARRIAAFRNVLIHAYDRVDANVVWDIVQGDLPRLLSEVDGLLREP
jgi:uncharacterized protein with HEPN domain